MVNKEVKWPRPNNPRENRALAHALKSQASDAYGELKELILAYQAEVTALRPRVGSKAENLNLPYEVDPLIEKIQGLDDQIQALMQGAPQKTLRSGANVPQGWRDTIGKIRVGNAMSVDFQASR